MNRDTRQTLDRQIAQLNDRILELTRLVEQAVLSSVQTLMEQDIPGAKALYEQDRVINQMRMEIERQALITVATQQPLATDLRILASVIDIAGELERIGDYAKGIARIALRLDVRPPLRELVHIPVMADLTADMLHRAVGSFVALDEDTARAIPGEDDRVDRLYNLVYQELLTLMIADRENIDRATFYIWVAHNLERAADRVTNICERTVFTTSGVLVEFDRSDDEREEF